MKNFKRLLASFVTVLTLLAITPVTAHAEWKQSGDNWLYIQSGSYATGWTQINGQWYYFYSSGYMATNVIIDGCYLNVDGVWSDDSKYNITIINAQERVKQYLSNNGISIPQIVQVDQVEGNSWVVHCYSIITDTGEGSHTATTGWYYVDRDTGNIKSMF